MSETLDDAAVTALVEHLRGVDPEGRSYAHVMTPLTHSLIREAADALERLATDLAAARAESERLRLVYTLANKAILVYLNKLIEVRAERDVARAEWQRLHDLAAQYRTERDDLRRQVAAVRALCEDPRPPESVHVPADMILAALDSAGQTEGEQP